MKKFVNFELNLVYPHMLPSLQAIHAAPGSVAAYARLYCQRKFSWFIFSKIRNLDISCQTKRCTKVVPPQEQANVPDTPCQEHAIDTWHKSSACSIPDAMCKTVRVVWCAVAMLLYALIGVLQRRRSCALRCHGVHVLLWEVESISLELEKLCRCPQPIQHNTGHIS